MGDEKWKRYTFPVVILFTLVLVIYILVLNTGIVNVR